MFQETADYAQCWKSSGLVSDLSVLTESGSVLFEAVDGVSHVTAVGSNVVVVVAQVHNVRETGVGSSHLECAERPPVTTAVHADGHIAARTADARIPDARTSDARNYKWSALVLGDKLRIDEDVSHLHSDTVPRSESDYSDPMGSSPFDALHSVQSHTAHVFSASVRRSFRSLPWLSYKAGRRDSSCSQRDSLMTVPVQLKAATNAGDVWR